MLVQKVAKLSLSLVRQEFCVIIFVYVYQPVACFKNLPLKDIQLMFIKKKSLDGVLAIVSTQYSLERGFNLQFTL